MKLIRMHSKIHTGNFYGIKVANFFFFFLVILCRLTRVLGLVLLKIWGIPPTPKSFKNNLVPIDFRSQTLKSCWLTTNFLRSGRSYSTHLAPRLSLCLKKPGMVYTVYQPLSCFHSIFIQNVSTHSIRFFPLIYSECLHSFI